MDSYDELIGFIRFIWIKHSGSHIFIVLLYITSPTHDFWILGLAFQIVLPFRFSILMIPKPRLPGRESKPPSPSTLLCLPVLEGTLASLPRLRPESDMIDTVLAGALKPFSQVSRNFSIASRELGGAQLPLLRRRSVPPRPGRVSRSINAPVLCFVLRLLHLEGLRRSPKQRVRQHARNGDKLKLARHRKDCVQ